MKSVTGPLTPYQGLTWNPFELTDASERKEDLCQASCVKTKEKQAV